MSKYNLWVVETLRPGDEWLPIKSSLSYKEETTRNMYNMQYSSQKYKFENGTARVRQCRIEMEPIQIPKSTDEENQNEEVI